MADVAFVGLGVMGFPMAGHLAAKGHRTTVYNRTAARAEECFLNAIAAGPPRMMHHAEYGLFLVAQGRKNDARKQLKTALSLSAKNPEDEETQERARRALATLR